MPLNNPKSGFNYAVEFQSSALPWATSSTATTTPVKIEFPYISRFIMLLNTSAVSSDTIRIGFTQNGVNGSNYIDFVGQTAPSPIELKVKEVWIRSKTGSVPYSLLAGLTNVGSNMVNELTGTLYDNTPGWQGVG